MPPNVAWVSSLEGGVLSCSSMTQSVLSLWIAVQKKRPQLQFSMNFARALQLARASRRHGPKTATATSANSSQSCEYLECLTRLLVRISAMRMQPKRTLPRESFGTCKFLVSRMLSNPIQSRLQSLARTCHRLRQTGCALPKKNVIAWKQRSARQL